MAPPHYAALDLGTNTFRLLIARPDANAPSGYAPVSSTRVITRAGGGFTEQTGFSPEARERILRCLADFRAQMDGHHVVSYRATATSVFRRARNRDEVIQAIRQASGLELEVVDGTEEAELSARGAVSQVSLDGPAVIFDIGGGSTEYIVWDNGHVIGRESFEFGVVRLSEDVLHGDPVSPQAIESMRAQVAPVIQAAARKALKLLGGKRFTLVGTAGTVSTLGAIDLGLSVYDRDRINGHRLRRKFVEDNFTQFSSMTRAARMAVPGMEEGREDLIVPGCFIASETLEAFGAQEILVSEGGLLEGVLFTVLERHRKVA